MKELNASHFLHVWLIFLDRPFFQASKVMRLLLLRVIALWDFCEVDGGLIGMQVFLDDGEWLYEWRVSTTP